MRNLSIIFLWCISLILAGHSIFGSSDRDQYVSPPASFKEAKWFHMLGCVSPVVTVAGAYVLTKRSKQFPIFEKNKTLGFGACILAGGIVIGLSAKELINLNSHKKDLIEAQNSVNDYSKQEYIKRHFDQVFWNQSIATEEFTLEHYKEKLKERVNPRFVRNFDQATGTRSDNLRKLLQFYIKFNYIRQICHVCLGTAASLALLGGIYGLAKMPLHVIKKDIKLL